MLSLEQEEKLTHSLDSLTLLPYTGSRGEVLQAAFWSSLSLSELQAKAQQTPLQGLLFLPGLGGSCLWAQPYLQPLLGQLDFVIGLDLQGFGLNKGLNKSLNPSSPEEQLALLLKALPQLLPSGVAGKTSWCVVGLSLGALMATRWVVAQQNQLSIKALALLSPAFAPHPKRFSKAFILKNVLRLVFNPKAMLTLPYGVSELTSNGNMWEGGLNENIYSEHGVYNPHPLTLPLSYMLKIPAFGKLASKACKALQVPVHLFVPEQDKICDPTAMQQTFKALPPHPKHACSLLPNAAHDLLLENEAPEYGKQLGAWLATL